MFSHFLTMNGVLMEALAGLTLCLAFIAAGLRCTGHRGAKRVALLSLLMAAGVLGLRAIPPSPTVNAPLPPRQAVAVLHFGVLGKSKYASVLSLEATRAAVREMNRSPHYSVTVPPVSGWIPDSAPSSIRLQGRLWGVDAVVAGDILNVAFTEKPRCAHVTLSVQILSAITGELVNGALQEGTSCAARTAVDADDAALIRQALTDAARRAVSTIDAYTLPEALILRLNGAEELTLNRGKEDGLIPGQEMSVIRGRDCVGKIRVSSTESGTATATILDFGKGIRPGDRAQTIFSQPCNNLCQDIGGITTSAP